MPLVASAPLQAPLAVQAVALVEDQVSVLLLPSSRLAGSAAMVTVGGGVAGAVTVSTTVCEKLRPLVVRQLKV